MQKRWPQQPLILMPRLPLMWGASYWCYVHLLAGCKIPVPQPNDQQVELALMIAMVWVVMSAFNQLLIYRNITEAALPRTKYLAIVNALLLICTIVLAWGKPAAVLFPRQLSLPVLSLLPLAVGMAALGSYFCSLTRQVTDLLPLWSGGSTLVVLAVTMPFVINAHWGWLLIIGVTLLIAAVYLNQLPRLLAKVPACRSALYNLMIGAELAALFSSLLLGAISAYQLMHGVCSRLNICWGSSLVLMGVGAMVIAACQRYHNDFRYGHAPGYEQWLIACGALCWIGILLLLIMVL